jgi:hypothetical protein
MALCLKYNVLTPYHARNYIMLVYSEVLLIQHLLNLFAILRKKPSHIKSIRILRHAATE